MERRAVRLIVKGRVQGVGYRWWAVGQAQKLGLDGWVRNRSDGSVELLAIGGQAELEHLIEACARGPKAAMVASVEPSPASDDGSVGFGERQSD
jgi:acylphosphatase